MALVNRVITEQLTTIEAATDYINSAIPVYGTAAEHTAANLTLSVGRFGFETDTGRIKIGDGATAWTSLAYIGAIASEVILDNPEGDLGDDVFDVQAFAESVVAEFLRQSDVATVTEVTSYAAGDRVLLELEAGGFVSIQSSLFQAGEPSLRSFSTTTDTLVLTDARGVVISTGTSAATVTIPAFASVALPINTFVEIIQHGAGMVTAVGASGVTLNGALTGSVATTARYGSLRLRKIGQNEWVSIGATGGTVTDVTAPTATAFSPAADATGVVTGITLVETFSEAVAFGTGNIVIRSNTGGGFADLYTFDVATDQGTTAGKVNIVGNQLFIYPDAALVNDVPHAVRIAATCIDDLAGNSYAGIADDTTWSFTTVAASPAGPTLLGTPASAAIGAGATNATVALPTLAQNDVVVIGCATDGVTTAIPTGYTSIYTRTGVNNPGGYVAYKVMGAVPDTTISVPRISNRQLAFGYAVLRGVTAIDGAAATATGASGAPNAANYAQTNANAFRFIFGLLDDDETTMTAPAGWTLGFSQSTSGAGTDLGASLAMAYQTAAGSGGTAVNPDAFGGGPNDEWAAAHFAFY